MKQLLRNRIYLLLVVLVASVGSMCAQTKKPHGGFNPQRFEADLEQYITTNAGLTPREAARFFPVYRQMTKKMRSLFDEMRRCHQVNPKDVNACAEAIRRQDEIDIQLKMLQQEYHSRFMLVLPANKVLEIIKAEDRFHRQMFRKMRK